MLLPGILLITLRIESVAEHTKRPLMVISTGELGSWEGRLSYELKKLLSYASIWKAIVLIDEADVFLEARKSTGGDRFQQNSMVAGQHTALINTPSTFRKQSRALLTFGPISLPTPARIFPRHPIPHV